MLISAAAVLYSFSHQEKSLITLLSLWKWARTRNAFPNVHPDRNNFLTPQQQHNVALEDLSSLLLL